MGRGIMKTTYENIMAPGQGVVSLVDFMGNDLSVVNAARVSFGKRADLLNKKDKVLIKYLAENRHTSPFEHVTFTFHIKCPLFIARQWHRHRTWSYNEVSRRYTSENIEFFVPTKLRLQDNTNNFQGSAGLLSEVEAEILSVSMVNNCKQSVGLYEEMLDRGVAREQARMILPQNMYTEFYATVNLWNLAHFLELRMDEHAQLEIQQYAGTLYEIAKDVAPISVEALLGKTINKG